LAALTADLNHPIKDGVIVSQKMAAVKIYKGAMVGMADETTAGVPDTGYVTNLATGTTNAMIFVGVAEEMVDNSGGSAGAKSIKVRRTGRFVFPKTSAVQADVSREFYASSNQDLTTTATKNAKVGKCTALIDSSHLEIAISNYA
jgi:hypothetical protein